jgi:hypothetical protein
MSKLNIPYTVMLGVRHPSASNALVDGPDVHKLSFLSAPSAPLQSPQIKKITHLLCDRLRRGSRTPPSLPRLPLAFLSIAATPAPRVACSPHEAEPPDYCCRLHRGQHVRSIARGRIATHPLPSSFSTAIT